MACGFFAKLLLFSPLIYNLNAETGTGRVEGGAGTHVFSGRWLPLRCWPMKALWQAAGQVQAAVWPGFSVKKAGPCLSNDTAFLAWLTEDFSAFRWVCGQGQ